ncbi:MAG: hypothetical protein AAB560_02180 [Patescibacteria group bacterium]
MKKSSLFIVSGIIAAGSTALAPLEPSLAFPLAAIGIVLLIAAITRRWDKIVPPRRRRKK